MKRLAIVVGAYLLIASTLTQQVCSADAPTYPPLVVVSVASQEERTTAEDLMNLANDSARFKAEAEAKGYKVIEGNGVFYLLPSRYWRDNTLSFRNEIAEQLLAHTPQRPFSTSKLTPTARTMLFQWLASNRNVPIPDEVAKGLTTHGYLWLEGSVAVEVQMQDGYTYKGVSFGLPRYQLDLNLLDREHLGTSDGQGISSRREGQVSEPTRQDILKEETLLFSQEVPQPLRTQHAKAYFEWVLYEYQEKHKRYEILKESLNLALTHHYGLPTEWQDGEPVDFSTLPQWMQDEIANRLATSLLERFEGMGGQGQVMRIGEEGVRRAHELLIGAKVKGWLSPKFLIGGFVNGMIMEYGFGLSSL